MSHRRQPYLLAIPVLSLACADAVAQSVLAQHAEMVMAVGDPVAAVPGATIYATGNFDSPCIDQRGTLLFRARMTGGNVQPSDDRAYFMARANGDLRMVVRASDQAPGCPTGVLLRNSSATAASGGLSGSPRISPFGDVLYFQSALYDPANPANTPTTADSALFWGPPGNLVLLAREGDPASIVPASVPPTTWGALSFSYQNNAINAAGQVLFTTALAGGAVTAANDVVMVSGLPGNLGIVCREGDVWPTGEVVMPVSGTTMSFINLINEQGMVLHEVRFATTAPSTATTANDRALCNWVGGSEFVVAREGQQAPGLPAGVLFATSAAGWSPSVSQSGFTRSGQTVLYTTLDGGGTTTADDSAVYFGGLGGLTLVFREGGACPGMTNGELFGTTGTASLMANDAGQVAFVNTLTGPAVTAANDSTIWFGAAGNLICLAREGDQAPGLAPSANGPWLYSQISTGTNTPYLIDGGRVLFTVTVTDGVAIKDCMFGYTPALGTILMMDNSVDTLTTTLGTGNWSTVSSIGSMGSGDGGPAWCNNNGDFAVRPNILGAPTAAIVRGHLGSLIGTPSSLPVATGGTQTLFLDAGAAQAGNLYLVAGSLSGTRPGFDFAGLHVPLNFDAWLGLSIGNANTTVYVNTMGLLDGQGRATAGFAYPAGFPNLVGANFHHAYCVIGSNSLPSFVSDPVGVLLY